MKQPPGRRPEWLIAQPHQQLPYVDVVNIGADGFTSLPMHGRRLILWLDELSGTLLLCNLKNLGCVELTPWELHGPRLVQTINAYADQKFRSPEETERLISLRAQFMRVQVYEKGRLKLPKPITMHLDPRGELPLTCHIAFFEERLELWSPAYRHGRVKEHGLDLAELLDERQD